MNDLLHELTETCALIRDSVTIALDDYDRSPDGMDDAYIILTEIVSVLENLRDINPDIGGIMNRFPAHPDDEPNDDEHDAEK